MKPKRENILEILKHSLEWKGKITDEDLQIALDRDRGRLELLNLFIAPSITEEL